ncbi:MAG: xanthine dehydrogenase molybdopterin binding subunit [Deltaproteobacteria bacterium]|nr:xanthine dehydrogenase molybdopterin binding subunit [Deltaproteobacteria bacterium]
MSQSPLAARVPHESAVGHVTGRAVYVDDMPLPVGGLHAYPVAAAVARGRILSVDATVARALPGVRAVLLPGDIPGHNQIGPAIHDEPLFAEGEVFTVGQQLGVVIGDSRDAARRGAEAVVVRYQELPARLTLAEGLAAGDTIGEVHRMRRGDADAAMAAAPHRLAGTVSSGGQEHFYLETHSALAIPGEDHTITVYSSTQHPAEVQALVAEVLGWSKARVTVISPRMGGAFGGKETQGARWAVSAALGAVATGRAVKIWLDRDLDMVMNGRRHPFTTDYEVGFDGAGRILSWKARIFADAGWASDLSLAILDRALYHADNTYFLPHVALDGIAVKTNTPSNTAYRGFGGPQGILVIETALDRIARQLGLDPVAVRQANLYGEAPRDLTPYHQEITDCRNGRVIAELTDEAHYAPRREAIDAFNREHEWVKRGLALVPVKFGISFTVTFLNQAGAFLTVYSDGSVQLNHGGTEMGQGLYTKMMQVCAQDLGVSLAHIRHMHTNTDKVPNTSATAASSGADLNGQAVADAAATLVARLREVAGRMLGHGTDVVQTAADPAYDARPEQAPDGRPAWAWVAADRAVSWEAVVLQAYFDRVQLSATGFYRTPGIWYDRSRGRGKPFYYFVYGAALAEVELNGLTGEWKLRRVDILHDMGDSLSPDLDRGQVEGAFVQGMGWMTLEELVTSEAGVLLTHAPSTYKIPAIGDVPEQINVRFLRDAHQDGVIHGSKAVGEPPFVYGMAAHRALADAVSAFAGGAFVELAAPATNEALLRAVGQARGR